MKLFDAHCHLQDPRIFHKAPQLIATTVNSGVLHFAVNGVSEVHAHGLSSFLFFFSGGGGGGVVGALQLISYHYELFSCHCRKIGTWLKIWLYAILL